jgi:RHS repeat-associated protein
VVQKGNSQPISVTDYYPFGEQLPSRTNGNDLYRYAFQGQELDKETGMEAFPARLYDGRIGRWLTFDPLAEKFPSWSPYNFCMNNPMNMIDPDGKFPFPVIVVLAVYLLTPETAIAPTGNWKSDGKAVGRTKEMKANILLSSAGVGLGVKLVTGLKGTPAKENAVVKIIEKGKAAPSIDVDKNKGN